MIILRPLIITRSPAGTYGQEARENTAELKKIMKDLIIDEPAQKNTWAQAADDDNISRDRDNSGGKLWARRGGATRRKQVKTFSI